MLTDAQLCQQLRSTNKESSQAAWAELIKRHTGLIRKLTSSPKYEHPGCTKEDMFQQGIIGFRYSCLSYNQAKNCKLTTHAGWGIMKYCMILKDKLRAASRESIVSQNESAKAGYQKVTSNLRSCKTFLSRQKFRELMHMASQHEGSCVQMTKEEMLTLKLVYRAGSPEKLEACREKLWQHWFRKSVARACAKLRRKVEEQESLWDRPSGMFAQFEEFPEPVLAGTVAEQPQMFSVN